MPKTENIIRYLPDFYGASEKETLLFRVIDTFSKKLQEVEDSMVEMIRAHWVDHANSMDTLARLGALYDIRQREGEDIEDYRGRLKETIGTYLSGVGTVQTVQRIVTASLNLEYGFDKQNFVEFPLGPGKSEEHLVAFGSEWIEETRGFGPENKESKPTIRITGIGGSTVNPVITNVATGFQVGFEGIVPSDKVLIIKPDGTASLDGDDVTENVYLRRGVQLDHAFFDECDFAVRAKGTPALPRGKSVWRYSAEGATFANGDEHPFSHFDRAIFDPSSLTPSGAAKVHLSWEEQQLATFVIKLPWHFKKGESQTPDEQDLLARHETKAAVDRVKAAGILAIIEYFEEAIIQRQYHKEQLFFRLQSSLHEENIQADRNWMRSEKALVEEQAAIDSFLFLNIFGMSIFDGESVFA